MAQRLFAGTLAALLALAVMAARAAEMPLVFVKSATTSAYYEKAKRNYLDDLLAPWLSLFRRHKIAVRNATVEELAALHGPAVMILPALVSLSEAERKVIRARVEEGWSVIAAGGLGTRNDKGASVGYGFIQELFDAKVEYDKPPADQDDRFLLPYGETPLTYRLPAGRRMYMRPSADPVLRVRTAHPAGRMSNYNRHVNQPEFRIPVMAYSERNGSRRAYIGIAESSWDSAQAEMDALLLGTLDWLRRAPIVFKSAWPEPYEAALLLEMDTEDKFSNGPLFAAELERAKVRGTFFCLTSEALKNASAVKRLASRHEIAYHAEVHDGFAKLPPERQEARMRAMVQEMSKLIPDVTKAVGFRPPYEDYDDNTERVLRKLGFLYLAGGVNTGNDALPEFSSAEKGMPPDKALVVLPRTWIDDIVLLREGKLDQADAEKMLLASLDTTLAGRSFGLLSVHSQHFPQGGPMARALPKLVQALAAAKDRVWATSGENIARWWRKRELVMMSAKREGAGLRIALKVAADEVRDLKLIVLAPTAGKAPRLQARGTEAKLRKLDAERWAIVLPELKKGDAELRLSF